MPLIETIKNFIPNNDACIYVWHITESITELISLLPSKRDVYIEQLSQFKSPKRQKEWLSIRVILHLVLGKDVQIVYNSFGKPFININRGHISISHSKSYSAIALSQKPIGIDLEECTDRAFFLKTKFLNNEEIKLLGRNPKDMALVFWCLKEAGFKLLMNTKDTYLSSISIKVNNKNTFLLEAKDMKAISNYILRKDFILTWAINRQ